MMIIKIIVGILTSIISTIIGIGLFWYVKESWKKGYIISGFIPIAIYRDRQPIWYFIQIVIHGIVGIALIFFGLILFGLIFFDDILNYHSLLFSYLGLSTMLMFGVINLAFFLIGKHYILRRYEETSVRKAFNRDNIKLIYKFDYKWTYNLRRILVRIFLETTILLAMGYVISYDLIIEKVIYGMDVRVISGLIRVMTFSLVALNFVRYFRLSHIEYLFYEDGILTKKDFRISVHTSFIAYGSIASNEIDNKKGFLILHLSKSIPFEMKSVFVPKGESAVILRKIGKIEIRSNFEQLQKAQEIIEHYKKSTITKMSNNQK